MKKDNQQLIKHAIVFFCVLAAVILFTRQAIITYQDTVKFGGTDLRVRIVGSRFMAIGMDPYFTKWRPGMGEYLCDPNDTYDHPMNGVTVTPFLLWLQQPLARLPYPTVRLVWWASQQCLYLFIIALCLYFYRKSAIALLIILLCATALSNHYAWILHSERGQIYILFAAWIGVLYALCKCDNKKYFWLIGAWLALGILMRPTLLLFGIPVFLAIQTKKGKTSLIIAGIASTILLLALSNSWAYWQSYFSSVGMYVNSFIHGLHFPQNDTPIRPLIIEGSTNITSYRGGLQFEYLKPLSYYLDDYHIWPDRKIYLICSLLLNSMWLLLTYLTNRFRLSAEQMLMLGVLLYTSTEFCQPFRGAYSIVTWLPIALIAMGYCFSHFKEPQLLTAVNKKNIYP